MEYKGAKVFSATKARERVELGNALTEWIQDNPDLVIKDTVVRQSSDNEFHCITIIVFYDFREDRN